MVFILNPMIVEGTGKYVDGVVIASVCNAIALVLVYRFWDSITEGTQICL